MALPLPPGLVPTEVAFLCEMEMVTVVPRQRLESIPLLSVNNPIISIISNNLTPPPRHRHRHRHHQAALLTTHNPII